MLDAGPNLALLTVRVLLRTKLWLFRETLAKAGLIEKLFERFGQHLEAKGYIAVRNAVLDAEPQKPRERQPVAHLILDLRQTDCKAIEAPTSET